MRPRSKKHWWYSLYYVKQQQLSFISEVYVALIVQGGMGVVQFKTGKLHCVAGSFWPSCSQTANYAETLLTLRIIAESHFVKGTYS